MNSRIPSNEANEHLPDKPALDLTQPIELIVLSTKDRSLRARSIGSACSGTEISVKTASAWRQVPGEIITLKGNKVWRYSGHWYLSGEVLSHRQDASALGLTPLKLKEHETWDPTEEYWGETAEPESAWAKAIIAHGSRPSFEMEQIIPGDDGDDFEDDITRSADLKEAGAYAEAESLLIGLLQQDLRCIDAHVHLGHLEFERDLKKSVRHYRMAQQIGDLTVGAEFRNVLRWGHINNRPYLRALHGLGLCLWRLNQRTEATALFNRMLWMNPTDNQGVRFLLSDIGAGMDWKTSCDQETASA